MKETSTLRLFVYCIFIWVFLCLITGCKANPIKSDNAPANIHHVINKLKAQYPNDPFIQNTKLRWSAKQFTAAAYATSPNNATLYLGLGITDIAKNDHELAMIISHELAHIRLRHSMHSSPKHQEKEADIEGALTLSKAGYDCKKAAKFWLRLYDYNTGSGYNKRGVWYDTHKKRHDTVIRVCELQKIVKETRRNSR